MRPSDPESPPFRLDRIFWLRGVHLPDRLWQPRPGPPEEGKYFAATCRLLDSTTAGKERYLVAYRHYVDVCCDGFAVFTFYALIGVRGDDPDAARSTVAFGGLGHPYYRPRKISMSPGADVRVLIDAGHAIEYGDLRDYHAHADDFRRRNGERPHRNPCPDK